MNRAFILVLFLTIGFAPDIQTVEHQTDSSFQVELFENIPAGWNVDWSFEALKPALRWKTHIVGFKILPRPISPAGLTMWREAPFAVRLHGHIKLAGGDYEFYLRAKSEVRFFVDGTRVELTSRVLTSEEIADKASRDQQKLAETSRKAAEIRLRQENLRLRLEGARQTKDPNTMKAVRHEVDAFLAARERQLFEEREYKSDTEPAPEMPTYVGKVSVSPGSHAIRVELLGDSQREGINNEGALEARYPFSEDEVSVLYLLSRGREPKQLAVGATYPFTEKGWSEWSKAEMVKIAALIEGIRQPRVQEWERYWESRHAAAARQAGTPDKSLNLGSPQEMPRQNDIDIIVNEKLASSKVLPTQITDDYEFVRRVYLDVWGLIPTAEEVRKFVSEQSDDKRNQLIDRLLADDRWADPWVGYWEDVLAENPGVFGGVPNMTGAFKQWIYRSFIEDRGYDRLATELILMEGIDEQQGTYGFRQAFGNDVPLAEKSHIISRAFMSANMKCARCHDSPINEFTQRDLFGLTAMLRGGPVPIPQTSSVGVVPGRRPPAVSVTTKPGELISPHVVFDRHQGLNSMPKNAREHRMELAERLTQDTRFAQVGVNRIWKRFMGTGLIEPVDDWDPAAKISQPKLMDYLVREFSASSYSVKRIEEIILKSRAYQRKRNPNIANLTDSEQSPLFAAQSERCLRGEEVVDSLHRAVGRKFRTERMAYNVKDYGYANRMWQVVSLTNEEDAEVLARPLLQDLSSTASIFGWREQRPDPLTIRDSDPSPLQPLMMANGGLMNRLIKLTDDSYYTYLSNQEISLDEFAQSLMLNILSRPPSPQELDWLRQQLQGLWADRRTETSERSDETAVVPPTILVPDHFSVYLYKLRLRDGEPATNTLTRGYRERLEEVLWVLFNTDEFVFVP